MHVSATVRVERPLPGAGMEGDAGADEASGAGLSFWDALSKGTGVTSEEDLGVATVRKEALKLATEARQPSKGQGLQQQGKA